MTTSHEEAKGVVSSLPSSGQTEPRMRRVPVNPSLLRSLNVEHKRALILGLGEKRRHEAHMNLTMATADQSLGA